MGLTRSDKDDVRQIVREELESPVTKKYFGAIVREETAGIHEELHRHGNAIESMREELYHRGVLLEDLNGKFDTVAEMLSNNLNIKSRADHHENRITKLEADNKVTKSVVALHSGQLKSLTKE